MKLANVLATLVAAGLAVGALPAIGCYATTDVGVVSEDPPPAREEIVAERPGYIFIHGRWAREGGRWNWHAGTYERQRPNQVYTEGRWDNTRAGRRWVEGGWHASGGVTVR